MKILLDENIDVRFKNCFQVEGHEVFRVKDMNWTGIKNGKLLQLMQEFNFHVLIAVDKNIPYLQNLKSLPVSIIILDVKRNVLGNLQPFVSQILDLLQQENVERKVVVLKSW